MQVDKEPSLLAGHSVLKRTASSRIADNEENRDDQYEGEIEGGSARKKKKVSQAREDVEAE